MITSVVTNLSHSDYPQLPVTQLQKKKESRPVLFFVVVILTNKYGITTYLNFQSIGYGSL